MRALLKNPDILVIDEGSAHLDAGARENLRAVVEEQGADKTCILITHDPAVIAGVRRA